MHYVFAGVPRSSNTNGWLQNWLMVTEWGVLLKSWNLLKFNKPHVRVQYHIPHRFYPNITDYKVYSMKDSGRWSMCIEFDAYVICYLFYDFSLNNVLLKCVFTTELPPYMSISLHEVTTLVHSYAIPYRGLYILTFALFYVCCQYGPSICHCHNNLSYGCGGSTLSS